MLGVDAARRPLCGIRWHNRRPPPDKLIDSSPTNSIDNRVTASGSGSISSSDVVHRVSLYVDVTWKRDRETG